MSDMSKLWSTKFFVDGDLSNLKNYSCILKCIDPSEIKFDVVTWNSLISGISSDLKEKLISYIEYINTTSETRINVSDNPWLLILKDESQGIRILGSVEDIDDDYHYILEDMGNLQLIPFIKAGLEKAYKIGLEIGTRTSVGTSISENVKESDEYKELDNSLRECKYELANKENELIMAQTALSNATTSNDIKINEHIKKYDELVDSTNRELVELRKERDDLKRQLCETSPAIKQETVQSGKSDPILEYLTKLSK